MTGPTASARGNGVPGAPPPDPAAASAARATTLNPRLAPQDLAAERGILGGILLTNREMWDVVETLRPEDFYRESHRRIFGAMLDLAQRNEPIDLITLRDELARRGELESAGGVAALAVLDASVPAAAHLGAYAAVVRDKARARRLIEAAHSIARDGYEGRGTVDALLDSAEQRIFDVAEQRVGTGLVVADKAMGPLWKELEALYERDTKITGVPSGLAALDEMTCGWQPGNLVVLAARPGMGKTTLALDLARVATAVGPAAFFSLEMTSGELLRRALAAEAKVDFGRIRTGRFLDRDWPRLASAAERIAKMPLYIDDASAPSALEMRAKCRRLKAQHRNLALVVVDYLQLMRHAEGESRDEQVGESARALKALAKDLSVPVVLLSQLNRNLEKRTDKRPVLADLRESGSIEAHADVVVFVYRDEMYDRDSREKGIAEIIIGKQRNGPTGTAKAAFLGACSTFANLAHGAEAQ